MRPDQIREKWDLLLNTRLTFYQQAHQDDDDTASFFWPETRTPDYELLSTHVFVHSITPSHTLKYYVDDSDQVTLIIYEYKGYGLNMTNNADAQRFWTKYFQEEYLRMRYQPDD